MGRYLLALVLVLGLALSFGGAQAHQPTAASPGATLYYIDGELADKATVDKLGPKTIAYMNVVSDDKARTIFGNQGEGVVVIVTNAHRNIPAVQVLNDKITRVAPFIPGTAAQASVNVLTPTALAYLTKTYPNSRIVGVTRIDYPSLPKASQVRYVAELAEGSRPHFVSFDEQGNLWKP
ncbi:MAG: hypothetical protein NVS3B25_13890 [Hymenobacter sp.]